MLKFKKAVAWVKSCWADVAAFAEDIVATAKKGSVFADPSTMANSRLHEEGLQEHLSTHLHLVAGDGRPLTVRQAGVAGDMAALPSNTLDWGRLAVPTPKMDKDFSFAPKVTKKRAAGKKRAAPAKRRTAKRGAGRGVKGG